MPPAPSGIEPAIEITFTRAAYPPSIARPFLPLRPAEHHAITYRALEHCLEAASGDLRFSLSAGEHPLSLGGDADLSVEVSEACQGSLTFEAGPTGVDDSPILAKAALVFDPPLKLRHLLGALQGLPSQHPVVRLLQTLIPGPLRQLASAGLETADLGICIHLRRLAVVVDPSSGELKLATGGTLEFVDRLQLPFDEVVLPALLATAGAADLSRVLNWLGALSDRVVDQLLDFPERVEGTISTVVNPPELIVRTTDRDGTRRRVSLIGDTLAGDVAVEATFSGTAFRRTITVNRCHIDPTRGPQLDINAIMATGARPQDARLVELDLDARPATPLPNLGLTLSLDHPLCVGSTAIDARVEAVSVDGAIHHSLGEGTTLSRPLRVDARLGEDSTGSIRTAEGTFAAALFGAISGEIKGSSREASAELEFSGQLEHSAEITIGALPELEIDDDRLRASAEGTLRASLRLAFERDDGGFQIDLAGSRASFSLGKDATIEVDRRALLIPAETCLDAAVEAAGIEAAGLKPATVAFAWRVGPGPCTLGFGDRSLPLLTADLEQGEICIDFDRLGCLSFHGQDEALERVRLLNAMLNPARDPRRLLDVLTSDRAMRQLTSALQLFSDEVGASVADLRLLIAALRSIFRGEGITRPADVIPREKLSRMLSLFLVGDASLQKELDPIVRQVTEGRGLPVGRTKQLLQRHFGEFDVDYEIAGVLNWLGQVLESGRAEPQWAEEELPLVATPRLADALAALPSADEIYQAFSLETLDEDLAAQMPQLAPELDVNQLAHLLASPVALPDPLRQRLTHVLEAKRRVRHIAEAYGGAEHAAQGLAIGSFIGDVIGELDTINCGDGLGAVPPRALGAEEIATLIQAGLAAGGRGSRRVQLNNRLLLELLRREPAEFTRAVMVALGHGSGRALTGILYAFLEQDQDQLKEPIDLPAMLGERLGVEVPRQSSYLAGGRRARKSYYAALADLADTILGNADAVIARRQHLQQRRHAVAGPPTLQGAGARLERRARRAIADADALGAKSVTRPEAKMAKARAAYAEAFDACARLLEHHRCAFQIDWFRDFWARNEEALRVHSVVRNYQENIDRVQYWLGVRSGGPVDSDDEQALVEAVVQALYFRPSDRQRLLDDPLVRLLIDPPAGRYHFTVISAMGVITDGEAGEELDATYRRLEERRGVRVIRANTATARSLEYNAERIIEAIARCDGPWGIIGYSQGCASALLAESTLLSGPPDRQRLLDRLISRNLLFSAANGSAHGTAGMQKFLDVLKNGERFLKHYQGLYSKAAIDLFLSLIRSALDSSVFVKFLGGTYSLSFERARELHRDGQFLQHVTTSCTRAIVEDDRLPETLEYFFYVLKALSGGAMQDTQVTIDDAVGYSTRVDNENTRAFARCAIDAMPQATHHWAPLAQDVEMVTTPRDRRLAIYDSPKDQLVWPWIGANARFGRIPIRSNNV